MGKKILKNMDWGILVCIVILLAIGLVALFSATQGTEYEEFKKQIMWLAISIPIMIILTFVDYNTISKISPILYVLMIISLIAVMFTKSVNGATSWFTIGSVSIQPAEFAKIIAIISQYLKSKEKLNKDTIVATVMSNLGLNKYAKQNGLTFVQTKVGDRYVLEEMLKNGYNLGGEQSGLSLIHI